jgi:transcriptional regulator
MTQLEVALELGITRQRVDQIEKMALRKIRYLLLQKYGNSVTLWDILPLLDKETHYVKMSRM